MATSDERNAASGAVPDGVPPGLPDPAAPATGGKPAGRTPRHDDVGRSRVGSAWIALIVAALLGIILLVFILQNLDSVEVELLFWRFSLPLGVTLLLSVIAGALVMALVGGVRIVQLRRAAHRD